MNILITGATGLVGSHVVTALIAAHHQVVCCVRDIVFAKNLFPLATVLPCDFIKDTSPDLWLERLNNRNIDVVINCVGVLYHPNKKIVWAVHYGAPCALFTACVQSGIKKIIQVSALGTDQMSIEYATSKKAVEDFLMGLALEAIILRPSLVYGPGSYGGSSLFRGLAGLPWLTPVPGDGTQSFQPVHVDDLSKAIVCLISSPKAPSKILHAVSDVPVTISDVLIKMRAWLGAPKTKLVRVPLPFIRLGALFGDLVPYSTLNSSSYKMLARDNTTTPEETNKFQSAIGFVPMDFYAGLYSTPSSVQDRWHAHLYFLRPFLQFSLAFIWLFTGLCSLFFYPKAASYALLDKAGVGAAWAPFFLYGGASLDILMGVVLFCSFKIKQTLVLQIMVLLFYTAFIIWRLPYLLFVPFLPVVKNLGLVCASLVLLSIRRDR